MTDLTDEQPLLFLRVDNVLVREVLPRGYAAGLSVVRVKRCPLLGRAASILHTCETLIQLARGAGFETQNVKYYLK